MNASQRIQETSSRIADNTAKGSFDGLITELVELKVAEQQAGAAAKIIEAENKQVGTLLDILV